MNVFLYPEVENEFLDAIEFYEEKESGLGYDFSMEVYSTIERIMRMPETWPILEDDIHQCLVNRFPFGLLYVKEQKDIYIVAVMHLHREPNYWKRRLGKG